MAAEEKRGKGSEQEGAMMVGRKVGRAEAAPATHLCLREREREGMGGSITQQTGRRGGQTVGSSLQQTRGGRKVELGDRREGRRGAQ